MRDIEFVNGEYYHVFNRGVEKRQLFLSDSDFERFIESMYLFNDVYYLHRPDPVHRISLLSSSEITEFDREQLVDVVAYCLMPNHFHLLIEQRKDGGVSRFLHKLNKGYSRHFNIKNARTGTLYEGSFKAIHVGSESYLRHLPIYIHLNALDLIGEQWRERKVSNWGNAVRFLNNYRWSSHPAYMGQEQYLPIISPETTKRFFDGNSDYLLHLKKWSGWEPHDYFADFSQNDVTR
jgi:putative transposase